MTHRDRLAAENAALRARISALSAASVRISASLDLETVLNEVVESARALTGARYGAIVPPSTRPASRRTSSPSGLHRRGAPHAPGMGRTGRGCSSTSRDLPGPVRLADATDYVRSLGFSPERLPSRAFQGTPMRHRGASMSATSTWSRRRTSRCLTDEDEEVLVLLASQAATGDRERAHLTATSRARGPIWRP